MGKLYDSDFYGWTIQQADALKRRSVNELDWENLIEEIESLGRSEARELRSHYRLLLLHLLKWQFQPTLRSRSWEATLTSQRAEAAQVLTENPGLKPRTDEIFASAYSLARLDAMKETGFGLSTFPEVSPYTRAQAMDETFFPGPIE